MDSKSGVSGAGRGLSLNTHFSEVNENVKAYGIDGHRHLPEIVQEVALLDPTLDARITFLPHLIPMTRGILSSCYATLSGTSISIDSKGRRQLTDLYREFYADEPFVRVVDVPPQTKQTWGNNYCLVYPTPRPPHRPGDGRELHRQPRQGRSGPGHPEHERHGRLPGRNGPRVPRPLLP